MSLKSDLPIVLLDEIGLEGLDGITIEGLWKRLSIRLNLPLPLNDTFCSQAWSFIIKNERVLFYALPKERPALQVFSNGADPLATDKAIIIYKYNLIDKDGILGSCEDYDTRLPIDRSNLISLLLSDVQKTWQNKLVMVGSQSLRESVLIPSSVDPSVELNAHTYCVLERIGRARYVGITSIDDMGKEPMGLYYFRKTLQKCKLITRQQFQKLRTDTPSSNSPLLQLSRFHRRYPSNAQIIAEKIVDFLLTKPKYIASYEDIKNHLGLAYAIIKKFNRSVECQTLFNTDMQVSSRELESLQISQNPESTKTSKEKEKDKNKDCTKDRTVRVFSLRDPKITKFDSSNLKEDDFEEEIGFLKPMFEGFQVSLIYRALKAVEAAKQRGISQVEIGIKLGLSKLNARALCRSLLALNVVTPEFCDVGRQRTARYITLKYKNILDKSLKDANQIFKEDEEIKIITHVDIDLPKIVDSMTCTDEDTSITYQAEEISKIFGCKVLDDNDKKTETYLNRINERLSVRMIRRCAIVTAICEQKLVIADTLVLLKVISASEKSEGYLERVCKKSILRILNKLANEKSIKLFNVQFNNNGDIKRKMFLCHPSISVDHDAFKKAAEQTKRVIWKPKVNLQKKSRKRAVCIAKTLQIRPNTAAVTKFIVVQAPFTRMRSLHTVLFKMSHEKTATPIDRDVALAYWSTQFSGDQMEGLNHELPTIYSLDVGPTMFMPPFEAHNHPDGWIPLTYLNTHMPLSLFLNIFTVPLRLNGFEEFRDHLIMQHYPVNNLPIAIRLKMKNVIRHREFNIHLVQRLCFLGLVQFGKYSNKSDWIYINRNAKLLNTTSSEGGVNKVSSKKYPEESFHFSDSEAVSAYWKRMQDICMSTKLQGNQMHRKTDKLLIVTDATTQRTIEEVIANDAGFMSGDRSGAAGLDSRFYGHLKKNWILNVGMTLKTKGSKSRGRLLADLLKERQGKFGLQKNENRTIYRIKTKTGLKKFTRILKKNISKYRRHNRTLAFDSADLEALKLKSKLRVKWHPDEDNVLLLCKVASIYLFPPPIKAIIFGSTYRDVLHWHYAKSLNKTSAACQRRVVYMMHNRKTVHSVYTCLEELRQNKEIEERFGPTFGACLKQKYLKNQKLMMNIAKIHFVELVVLLRKYIFRVAFQNANFIQDIIPNTITEYKKMYNEVVSELMPSAILHLDPMTPQEIDLSTLNLVMHSSMCCAGDRASWNFQLFDIYKNFPEQLLQIAKNRAKSDHMIAARKHSGSRVSPPNKYIVLPQNPHRLSITYQQQLMLNMPYETYCEIVERLSAGICDPSASSTELLFTNAGICLLLIELCQANQIEIDIKVPKQILILDPQAQLDASTMEQIKNRLRLAVEDSEDTMDGQKKRRKPKFLNDNEVFVYKQTLFERMQRIEDHQLHFVCILNSLGKTLTSKPFICVEENVCAFDCLLVDPYLYTRIFEVIAKKKDVLVKIRNRGLKINYVASETKLREDNIQDIHKRIVQEFDGRRVELNSKDFGKTVVGTAKPLNILDLIKEIANVNVESDEMWLSEYFKYENDEIDLDDAIPSMMELKDELDASSLDGDRTQRLSDCVVINTSKLFVEMVAEQNARVDQVQEMMVPRVFATKAGPTKDTFLENIRLSHIFKKPVGGLTEYLDEICHAEFKAEEKSQAIKIYEFIEKCGVRGTTTQILKDKFLNVSLLVKTTAILRKLGLICRVGVENFSYVHWMEAERWFVKAYHLLRLDKEAIDPVSSAAALGNTELSRKRKTTDETEAGPSKQLRSNKSEEELAIVTIKNDAYTTKSTKNRETFLLRPAPWIRIDGTLNRRVLDKWMGTILLYVLSNPGLYLLDLCKKFHFLHPVHVCNLIEYLMELECVQTKVMCFRKPSLWSTDDTHWGFEPATEFHKTGEVFVEVLEGATTKMALFIGKQKYKKDFI